MRAVWALAVLGWPMFGQCPVRETGVLSGRSRLQVELATDRGKLIAVAGSNTLFKPSKEFSSAPLDDPAKTKIASTLVGWLNQVLDGMDPFYTFFLTDAQKALDKKGEFTAQTSAVRSLTKNSADTVAAFQTWSKQLDPSLDFQTQTNKGLQHLPGAGLDAQTPMFATSLADSPTLIIACLSTDDLVGANPVDVQFVPAQSKRTLLSTADVLQWVGLQVKADSDFWLQKNIQTHFQNLYADIGLQPAVVVSPAGKRPRFIHILESAKVSTIQFPATFDLSKPDSKLKVEKILYLLLPSQWFWRFRIDQVTPAAAPQGPVLPLEKLKTPTEDLPSLDLLALADKQADLQALGYMLSVTQASDDSGSEINPFVDFIVTAAAAPAETQTASTPAANGTNATSRHGRPLQSVDPANAAMPPAFSLAGGLEYRPGQSVRLLGTAEISRLHLLSPNGSIQLTAGADTTHPIGILNLNNDFLFFDALGRHRLSFTTSAESDVISKRLLAGRQFDQRTNGGSADSEFDFFRELDHWLMRWTGEFRHESVSLQPSGSSAGARETHLTTVDTGLLFGNSTEASFLPRRFQLWPHFKYGLGLASGEPVWHEVLLAASWHQRMSDAKILSLDVTGNFEQSSRDTPLFELPSLGGADSVRGFRPDSGLGRRYWNLQTEFWAPVPGTVTPKDSDTVRQFLRKNVRLAAFVDLGGIYDTMLAAPQGAALTSAASGFRLGPGVGLRILQGPIALKLDWAYGLGGGPAGDGHGRFYIGVSKNGF